MWVLGAKPSLAKSRGVPTSSINSNFSSPPTGERGSTMFEKAPAIAATFSLRFVAVSSAIFTRAAKSEALAMSALTCSVNSGVGFFLSAPCSGPISLPRIFCSLRNESNARCPSRAAMSASSHWSTRLASSPRLVWDSRTSSGFVRKILGSITVLLYFSPNR